METLDECLSRVNGMASGDPTWDLSENDIYALRAVLREVDTLRKQLHDLREAISPGRVGRPEYYVGVATRMRSREMEIKPL